MSNRWIYRRYKIETLLKGRVDASFDEQNARELYSLTIPNGNTIIRARVVGNVIKIVEGENNYKGILLDDGSGSIWIKDWIGRFDDIKEWSILDISGDIRIRAVEEKTTENDDEVEDYGENTKFYDIYLQPVAITKVNNTNWIIVHDLEIATKKEIDFDSYQTTSSSVFESEEEVSDDSALEKRVKDIILQLDEGNGVDYSEIIQKTELDTKKLEEILFNMMLEGSIYEPKPGYYSVLD